jgi:hypothetical protein
MSSSYIYQPLADPSSQIRLLHIVQGGRDDPIICTIEAVERNTDPNYIAVSYTWGAANAMEIIFVNGQQLEVRRNCFFALWQLRLHNLDMPIWIDSICIDQRNNVEKSKQVRLMGTIYARAFLTAACLGQGLELSAVIQNIKEHSDDNDTSYEPKLGEEYTRVFNTNITDKFMAEGKDLFTLASNPYFKRLWIVQELYHSKHIVVLCGEDGLPWHDLEPYFLEIAEITSRYVTEDDGETSGLADLEATELARFIHFRKFRLAQLTIKAEWTDEITGHGFTGVLLSFGEGECVDPRDKIYGLLSLAQDARWLVNFPIDYNRSLPEVLQDVASRIGSESLSENTSRLIANMLRWFDIDPTNISGQILLEPPKSSDQGPLVPWSNFQNNVISYESVRVWRIYNLPFDTRTFLPHSNNTVMYFNGGLTSEKPQHQTLNWRRVCLARGKMIKTASQVFWIAGPEVKPGDFIVEIHPMRDDKDEETTVVICRLPNRKATKLDIVDQASALVDLETYDNIYKTGHQGSWSRERISKLEKRYLRSGMLFARPHDDRMTVYLRPFDLIKLVMLRGHIINRIRYPILTKYSKCYAKIDEEDKNEVKNRTFTITLTEEEVSAVRLRLEGLLALERYCNSVMDMIDESDALLTAQSHLYELDTLLLQTDTLQVFSFLAEPDGHFTPEMSWRFQQLLHLEEKERMTELYKLDEWTRQKLLERLMALQSQRLELLRRTRYYN